MMIIINQEPNQPSIVEALNDCFKAVEQKERTVTMAGWLWRNDDDEW